MYKAPTENEMSLPSTSRRPDSNPHAVPAPSTIPAEQVQNGPCSVSQKRMAEARGTHDGCIFASLPGTLGPYNSSLTHGEATHGETTRFRASINSSANLIQNQIIGRLGMPLVRTQGSPKGQESITRQQGGVDKKLSTDGATEFIHDDFLLSVNNGFDFKTHLNNTKLENKKGPLPPPNLALEGDFMSNYSSKVHELVYANNYVSRKDSADQVQGMSGTLQRPATLETCFGKDGEVVAWASQELARR